MLRHHDFAATPVGLVDVPQLKRPSFVLQSCTARKPVGLVDVPQLRQQHRRSLQQQLIADLESPRRSNRNRYPAIAELLQREAAATGKLHQYTDLIWRLGAADVSERIELEVAKALRDVWGLR